VTFIAPVLNRQTRDVSVRLEFANDDGLLKPGMYADVGIRTVLDEEALLIPREAVIRSGERDVVFIARGEGRFVPTDVTLGPQAEDGMIQVIAGLGPAETIVTSAQFLLDSESSFQEALRKMRDGAVAPEMDEHRPTGDATIASTGESPFVDARYEGEPVANAVSIEPDGSIKIVCPVMKGEAVVAPGDIYSTYEGMRVYYCCPGCQGNFESDPDRYFQELTEFLGAPDGGQS